MKRAGKILLIAGLLMVCATPVLILLYQFVAVKIVFSGGGFEEGGHILFVNKENPDILILRQFYNSGAWDGSTSSRIIKKNITKEEVEAIDISKIDKHQWVQIKVPYYIWNSHDHGI